MKTKLSIVVLLVLALTAPLVGAAGAQGPGAVALARTLPTGEGAATAALQSSPVPFIENAGQFAEGARFQVRGGDHTLWLSEGAIWFTVLEKPSSPQPPSPNLGEEGDALHSPTSPPTLGGPRGGGEGPGVRAVAST